MEVHSLAFKVLSGGCMKSDRWLDSLRGVKNYLFILTSISLSLFFSVIPSQPASAEGFLFKTVRCVVGGLLGSDCQTAPTPAPTPAPAPSTPAPAEPQPANPSQPQQSAPSATQPQAAPVRKPANTQLNEMAPINIDMPQTSELPALPATRRDSVQASTIEYAFANRGVFGQNTTSAQTDQPAFQPSREGWRILGISWYWWAAGIGVIVGVGLWMKKKAKGPFRIAK
jgi:pyruvate/2-oxoglutarate dehydrogenase complex dihydrolipoamide acyltransferase (E2) component